MIKNLLLDQTVHSIKLKQQRSDGRSICDTDMIDTPV